ncbi:MAG: hypothetical protein IJO03_10580 [Clostridia bacterium]|nr:hypothetical protein [Clostridia bacterium]
MSKKNNTKKKTAKKQVKAAPDKKKIAIIAVAALVVAAAVALAVYFVTKDDGGKPAVTEPIVTVDNGGSQYTYAEYKGTKMPVEFVEILNQAELDSAEMCKEYGVALEVGDREISMPEFLMYYYDAYYFQNQSVEYSIETTGQNRTGYDPGKDPADQKYLDKGYTWSEKFTLDAIEILTANYSVFDLAVEAGTQIDGYTISTVFDVIEIVDDRAQKNKTTPEKDLAETYCEGLSPAVFKAREIIATYAEAYENNKYNELLNGYSDEEISEKFDSSDKSYSVASLRVYPIEGDYNEAEANAVSNEKEFLEYAQKNYPYDGYDAEFSTNCGYITKEKVANVYGDEVADWAFETGRKKGDIAVIEGMLFRYVVYVDTPQFLSTSCDIMIASAAYESYTTQEEKEEHFKRISDEYNEWKKGGATKEAFEEFSINSGGAGEETVRVGDYYFEIENWIFDPARKNGDSTVIDTTQGACAIYYIEKNEKDFDWQNTIREETALEDINEMYSELRSKDYKVKRNDSVLKKVYDEGYDSIKRHQKRIADKKK